MPKNIITRTFIKNRINILLDKKVSTSSFGEEMIGYLIFDEKYTLEEGYEKELENILSEFADMHDADKGNVGYRPHIPSRERLIELKAKLEASLK
jgi:hypothetical protein